MKNIYIISIDFNEILFLKNDIQLVGIEVKNIILISKIVFY